MLCPGVLGCVTLCCDLVYCVVMCCIVLCCVVLYGFERLHDMISYWVVVYVVICHRVGLDLIVLCWIVLP